MCAGTCTCDPMPLLAKTDDYQQLPNQEKSIPAVDSNSKSNVNSETLITESVSLAKQISKFINPLSASVALV